MGLPVWAASAIAAFVVVGAVGVALVLALSGGGSSEPSSDEPPVAEPVAEPSVTGPSIAEIEPREVYTASVQVPLNQLTASAVATGKALGKVSEPGEIRAFNRAVERQIDVVEAARQRLAGISVDLPNTAAHKALINAAATQRRYLVQLSRASGGEPSQAALSATNRARKAGAQTLRAYRTFFTLAPEAPDAITATDLADTAGLRSAIMKGIAAQATPAPAPTPTPAPSGTFTGVGFQSPTSNLRCEVEGGTLFCLSLNDSFTVGLPEAGPPITGVGPAAGDGVASGGVTVPYGSSWANGPFRCDSATTGITCRNASGNGFALSRDAYNAF